MNNQTGPLPQSDLPATLAYSDAVEQSAGTDQQKTVIEPKTTFPGLLAGLTYQTPVIGAIRIGSVEVVDGRRLPVRDDHFSINTRFRSDDGQWARHAAHELMEKDPNNLVNDKLRSIPVRIIYDNPNLNMGEQYAAFKKDGRPACVGNGVKAKRAEASQVTELACPGPALCEYGAQKEHRCDTYARAMFHLEGQGAHDGAFIFRTGSYNSVNDMRVRLQALHAGFGGKLSGLPMKLTMRLKSTAQSYKQAFFYVSLEPRFESFKDALTSLKARDAEEKEAGFDRVAYEGAMVKLLANGSFTDEPEDVSEFEDLLLGRDAKDGAQQQGVVSSGGLPDLGGLLDQYRQQPGARAVNAEASI
jgi:hypothetical protein